MKLITENVLAQEAPERYRKQYINFNKSHHIANGKSIGEIQLQLDLASRLNPKTVEEIIGNASWTTVRCENCNNQVDAAVEFSNNATGICSKICIKCLKLALNIFGEDENDIAKLDEEAKAGFISVSEISKNKLHVMRILETENECECEKGNIMTIMESVIEQLNKTWAYINKQARLHSYNSDIAEEWIDVRDTISDQIKTLKLTDTLVEEDNKENIRDTVIGNLQFILCDYCIKYIDAYRHYNNKLANKWEDTKDLIETVIELLEEEIGDISKSRFHTCIRNNKLHSARILETENECEIGDISDNIDDILDEQTYNNSLYEIGESVVVSVEIKYNIDGHFCEVLELDGVIKDVFYGSLNNETPSYKYYISVDGSTDTLIYDEDDIAPLNDNYDE